LTGTKQGVLFFLKASGSVESEVFFYFSPMNKTINLLLIILFNVIPIIGVAIFSWQPFEAFWFFWLETLVIAGFNVIRIVYSQGQPAGNVNPDKPLVLNFGKGIKYLVVRIGVFLFYAIFIITFIGFVANTHSNKGEVLSTLLFQNKLFNAGLLISIVSQGYYLLMGFFRNGNFYTSAADSFASIFDGRQLVIHIAIVVGALGSIFLEKNTSFGIYGNIFITSMLCICKCIFDVFDVGFSANGNPG
jgi:hypothetical protein